MATTLFSGNVLPFSTTIAYNKNEVSSSLQHALTLDNTKVQLRECERDEKVSLKLYLTNNATPQVFENSLLKSFELFGIPVYMLILSPDLDVSQPDLEIYWQIMEEKVIEGSVMNIGLANISQEKLTKLLTVATIKPLVFHVPGICACSNSDLGKLVSFARDENITVLSRPSDNVSFAELSLSGEYVNYGLDWVLRYDISSSGRQVLMDKGYIFNCYKKE
eukprot:TRINITY_DN2390_c0_g1_i1.p1 TRINITY_DN2390_c0_g1~~TRINITY_DN2390_c0_g1_i1.p1  ORF type:complete len:220 (+),score=38.20 TRINITY_DN2390_c0_g1_i1:48-707(+)